MNSLDPGAWKTILDTFIGTSPLLLAVVALLVRTEHRITKIETIIAYCPFCTPEKHHPPNDRKL